MVKRLFYRHCVKMRSDSSSQLYLPRRESGAHSFPAFCTLSIPSSGPRHHDASPFHCKTPHLKFNRTFVQIPLQLLGGCTFLDPGPNQSKIQHTHNVESINLVQGTQFQEKCIYIKVMHDHECMYTVLQGQIYHAQ